MDMPACAQCGEKLSPDWIVCPVCTKPTKKSALNIISCLQCGGTIHPDHMICPHCHVPITRRYCAGCERLIPDHCELCPYCRASRSQKRSIRRLIRVSATVAVTGLFLVALALYLPRTSPTPALLPAPSPALAIPHAIQQEPTALETIHPEPQLLYSVLPFAEEDLAPLITNTVEPSPVTADQDEDLFKRGARLKAGRKLSELGRLYIRKRRYREAAVVLKQAIQAFPPETRDVSYGESLYHLGYSLRMSGKPAEAIPVLKLALTFPLYSSKVERELNTVSKQMKRLH
jgi:RNA polymerase subunit RPABC4/transcription elongation factor Spt4